jgi:predicted alpha/beta-fold hydrolase
VRHRAALDYPEHGGHVGFAGRPPGRINWLPKKLIHFLEQHG